MRTNTMWNFWLMLLYLIGFTQGEHQIPNLFCHQCLVLNCPTPEQCNEYKDLVRTELAKWYHFDELQFCPGADDTAQWKIRQIENTQCYNSLKNEATCSFGYLQIVNTSSHGITTVEGGYFGCTKAELLKSTTKAFDLSYNKIQKDCFEHNSKVITRTQKYQINFKHCFNSNTLCQHDYCVSWKIVKTLGKWEDNPRSGRWQFIVVGTIVGVLAFVVCCGCLCLCFVNRTKTYTTPEFEIKSINSQSTTL